MPSPEEITRHLDDTPPPGESPWVGGYRPRTGVEVAAYDEAWPARFEGLRSRIVAALGDRAVHVEHVGSTSVPGLPAKPVIDVDLTVADPSVESAYVPDLEAIGFRLVVREPWWHEHRLLDHEAPRCNLHVFGPDSAELTRHLLFRDRLREHPDELASYRDAKLGAAADTNAAGADTMDYNARKEPVILAIYDRAFRAAGLLRE